ncbi:hypothetical protein DFH11DRAFT_1731656 [Phellopilus nigrolimitatus]|nr:hypothetical protein DFH11DRAFT_1731656 [Phellopilus nigrolimitatus]
MSASNSTVDVSIIENTVGLLQLGGFANSILYGVNCVQAYTFYQHADKMKDDIILRSLVGVLWILNTLHVGFNIKTVNFYLVKHFNDVGALANTDWSLACQTLLTMISNFLVRMFFSYRIWIISRGSFLVTLPVAVLSFLSFSFGTTFAVESFIHRTFAAMHGISWLVYVPLAIASVSDICMTGALCYFLYTNRTGVRRTDSIINTLMAYCINASLLTTCINIACFVTFLALPKNYIFMAIFFCSSKLYFCSLLATLNARDTLRARSTAVSMPTLGATHRHGADRGIEEAQTISTGFSSDQKDSVLPIDICVSVSTGTDSRTHDGSICSVGKSPG